MEDVEEGLLDKSISDGGGGEVSPFTVLFGDGEGFEGEGMVGVVADGLDEFGQDLVEVGLDLVDGFTVGTGAAAFTVDFLPSGFKVVWV
jgi:hypothetical protein